MYGRRKKHQPESIDEALIKLKAKISSPPIQINSMEGNEAEPDSKNSDLLNQLSIVDEIAALNQKIDDLMQVIFFTVRITEKFEI